MKDEHSQIIAGAQKKRLHVALPIRVTYWDDAQKPCLEIACTYDISEHGARVTGLRCVKEAGEVIAIERGKRRHSAAWSGSERPDTEAQGQIGLQCVESDRILWEAELRDMVDVYEPVLLDGGSKQPRTFAPHERRRRRERFSLQGTAELVDKDAPNFKGQGDVKEYVRDWMPGPDQKDSARGHRRESDAPYR